MSNPMRQPSSALDQLPITITFRPGKLGWAIEVFRRLLEHADPAGGSIKRSRAIYKLVYLGLGGIKHPKVREAMRALLQDKER